MNDSPGTTPMARKTVSPFVRFLIEVGPLAVFFIANNRFDIFTATAAFMVAVAVSLAFNYSVERRLPVMPLATGVFVMVMGGLTLYLQDDLFIKLKPTVTNILFAGILLGGLAWGKLFLRHVFGAAFTLDDAGWRIMTLRWVGFFLVLAAANEVVWRNFDTDTWVNFKVFGIMPLTFIFTLLQIPLIRRHGGFAGMEEDTPDSQDRRDGV